jgi:hypothetical protein
MGTIRFYNKHKKNIDVKTKSKCLYDLGRLFRLKKTYKSRAINLFYKKAIFYHPMNVKYFIALALSKLPIDFERSIKKTMNFILR